MRKVLLLCGLLPFSKRKFAKTKWLLVLFTITGFIITSTSSCSSQQPQKTETNMEYNKLTPEEGAIIIHKGTEYPYTGEYIKKQRSWSIHLQAVQCPTLPLE